MALYDYSFNSHDCLMKEVDYYCHLTEEEAEVLPQVRAGVRRSQPRIQAACPCPPTDCIQGSRLISANNKHLSCGTTAIFLSSVFLQVGKLLFTPHSPLHCPCPTPPLHCPCTGSRTSQLLNWFLFRNPPSPTPTTHYL